MYKKISFILASFFGAGYFPFASGTFGSLVTLPLVFAATYCYGMYGLMGLTIAAFFIGWLASNEVLKYTEHDPSLIVIDEVAGQSLTFVCFAEQMQGRFDVLWLLAAGFILFRLFDIAKPFPVSWVDKNVRNGFGVMFDDILAGVYGAAILWAVGHYLDLFAGF